MFHCFRREWYMDKYNTGSISYSYIRDVKVLHETYIVHKKVVRLVSGNNGSIRSLGNVWRNGLKVVTLKYVRINWVRHIGRVRDQTIRTTAKWIPERNRLLGCPEHKWADMQTLRIKNSEVLFNVRKIWHNRREGMEWVILSYKKKKEAVFLNVEQ